jgi:dTDP-4-dehydrorhamnose 3,5-epimerase
MIFHATPLADAYTVAWQAREDDRGLFARAFCVEEFARQGLCTSFPQANISCNRLAGTVRGMHFQVAPHAEVKVVRCVKGALYDVIVDNRPESPTYLHWFGAELSDANGLMMYVPQGFAHGYQALTADATAFYLVSAPYAPHAEGGLRHDDPRIAIRWPLPIASVSPKDASWPLLSPQETVQ